MNLWKIIQKQIYDLLSNKYSVIFLLLLAASILVTGFQFGETWLEWSRDKYASMFNQFSDNISGKPLQKILCQSVPIDVVYTWVNGSDPELLQQLHQVRNSMKHGKAPSQCFYRNCVPSHFLSVNGELPKKVLKHLKYAQDMTVVNLRGHNWTLISFPTAELASEAQGTFQFAIDGRQQNFTFFQTHWTTDSGVTNAVAMQHYISILGIHSGLDEAGVTRSLPWSLQPHQLWLHLDHGLAVALLSSSLDVNILSKTYSNITVDGKEASVKMSYLILKMPSVRNPEDFSASRFEDKEELRYSLRSLQKFAPWVRHVFLVTNGQIPYWLNLDQSRLTIITHEELFLNKSHLPTFSSPAIESHLHRIPGLSKRFLYLNDDVMFGKLVWPEDFYTETKGQKVYLSWPVPECHEGCPSTWIADGYCDRACNKSDCMWDGGDCKDSSSGDHLGDTGADSILMPDSDGLEPWPGAADDPGSCASNCADSWLADKYCDATCNTLSCGYDAGDCGTSNYHNVHDFKYDPSKSEYELPNGYLVGYWNVSRLLSSAVITSGEFDDAIVVRVWALCLKFGVLTVILRPGHESATLYGVLRGSRAGHRVEVNFEVRVNTSTPRMYGPTPRYLHQQKHEPSLADSSAGTFKPFNGFSNDIILEPRMNKKHNLSYSDNGTRRKILSFKNDHFGFLPWERHSSFERATPRIGRKLLDTFGESLLHVNRLYNREFGFESRRVPAHMAHLIDKDIMEQLQQRFPNEWDETSSHKIRSSLDMQYAFSYFYFLMNERENVSASEIFDKFDTDKSGTWSDREIRTLLTRLHDLPISFAFVSAFEANLINCSERLPYHLSHDIQVPPYERYIDSKMPTVSRELVTQCLEIANQLTDKFGSRKKYIFDVVGEENVLFKMLSSNLSQVIGSLDEVRKKPKLEK